MPPTIKLPNPLPLMLLRPPPPLRRMQHLLLHMPFPLSHLTTTIPCAHVPSLVFDFLKHASIFMLLQLSHLFPKHTNLLSLIRTGPLPCAMSFKHSNPITHGNLFPALLMQMLFLESGCSVKNFILMALSLGIKRVGFVAGSLNNTVSI